ncbi:ROK family protein [Candidatus Methylospira mobilis]|uniref:ROK family protein n=1 Tax=Candidatus Methylospira mobilis TaxID=1808979 RepID=UPI0028E4216C|nr:ROK family protein [Candidatus Methylospira mobilis]WNV05447.1 ROK family protein [Candidatus Methylospira mobilis]
MTIKCGIDLGGTKIELLALNGDGNALFRRRVATPQGDYRATLIAIRDLIENAEQIVGAIRQVGIGTPGAFSRVNGSLKNSNSTCLNGKPIHYDLEMLLHRQVRIANDADCFALSEAVDGAASGADTVFGVILGTGVGGGIIVNGRPLSGPNAIAGEWGHNPLPWPRDDERPGPSCYCGRSGCIETFLSGPGLSRACASATGFNFDAAAIAENALQEDAACETLLQQYEERLARALAHVINILDPDVIVLGGGLSKLARLYENVPHYWGDFVFSDRVDTRLVAPTHGDSSGVRGAAWLWE